MKPDSQLIQTIVKLAMFHIRNKRSPIIITNKKEWTDIFPRDRKHMDITYGATNNGFIFLNFEIIKTHSDLIATIYHELLHMKYPKKSERQIRKLEKEFVGN